MTEQLANAARTTLNGSISNSSTSIIVQSPVGFPTSPQYRIVVDSEIMLVTGGTGTSIWTVTRAAEGSTASTHANGATVTLTLTAGAIDQLRADAFLLADNSTLPAPAKAGRIIQNTNYPSFKWRDNGTALELIDPVYVPAAHQITPTTFSGNFNLGDTTNTNFAYYGGVLEAEFALTGSNPTSRGWYQSLTATEPFNVNGIIRYSQFQGENYGGAGICIRNSSSGEYKMLYINAGSLNVNEFDGTGTFQSTQASGSVDVPGNVIWLQFRFASGNVHFMVSYDGRTYRDFGNTSNNNYFTVDQVGVGGECTLSSRTDPMYMAWLGFWVD